MRALLDRMLAEHDAEDAVQEVALSAWRAIPALHDAGSFAAWLRSIARNVGRDAIKLRSRAGDTLPLPRAEAAGLCAHVPARGGVEHILAQVRALPTCYRGPLWLRLILDLSGPEIADRIGMTSGSVRVNLHRGMKLLRHRLLADNAFTPAAVSVSAPRI